MAEHEIGVDPAMIDDEASEAGEGSEGVAQALEERARAAEQRAGELEAKVAELDGALRTSREALNASEQRRQIERALAAEGAFDIDAAADLVQAAIAEGAEVSGAAADLRHRQPDLFRSRALKRSAVMSREPLEAPQLDDAAVEARTSGDRRALMRYLRLRRGG